MQICQTKAEFRGYLDEVRSTGRIVGLVPTMGALHAGHRSLIEAAVQECDLVALTIFVNPLQFAPTEDLSKYPRPLELDLELARAAGVGAVLIPSVDEMYPRPTATTVHVEGLTASMEGAARPTHFDGVTTVVTKLFNIAGPCRAYFGEKDFQQLAVVRRMAADLDQPVEVVACPIIRETDGLALSSRNVYLSAEDRAAATVLHRSLLATAELIAQGERRASAVAAHLSALITSEQRAALEYAEIVDPVTLEPLELLGAGTDVRLVVTARFGTTRLLDNLGVRTP